MQLGIRVKMGTKQLSLLLMIFFSLVLVSSSTKIFHPEKLQDINIGERKQHFVADISSTGHSSGHGGSSGGSAGGGRGTGGGDGSQGDTGSETRNPSGESNMNHHRRGATTRVQTSVFLTWVIAILAIQFFTQVL